jgi:hypothetical protein
VSGGDVRRLDSEEATNQRKIPLRFEVKVTARPGRPALARRFVLSASDSPDYIFDLLIS